MIRQSTRRISAQTASFAARAAYSTEPPAADAEVKPGRSGLGRGAGGPLSLGGKDVNLDELLARGRARSWSPSTANLAGDSTSAHRSSLASRLASRRPPAAAAATAAASVTPAPSQAEAGQFDDAPAAAAPAPAAEAPKPKPKPKVYQRPKNAGPTLAEQLAQASASAYASSSSSSRPSASGAAPKRPPRDMRPSSQSPQPFTPARITSSDAVPASFNPTFASTSTPSPAPSSTVDTALRKKAEHLSPEQRRQNVLEAVGGDYSRFLPRAQPGNQAHLVEQALLWSGIARMEDREVLKAKVFEVAGVKQGKEQRAKA